MSKRPQTLVCGLFSYGYYMSIKNIFKLLASLVICQLAGVSGLFFSRSSISSWYIFLKKPFFTPPAWVFAPAWILLYLLMAVSAYIIWSHEEDAPRRTNAMAVFILQLAMNAAWSPVFFGLRSPASGLAVIIILWVLILVTILEFFKLSKTAGYLLLPYIVWVSFAALLNASIVFIN